MLLQYSNSNFIGSPVVQSSPVIVYSHHNMPENKMTINQPALESMQGSTYTHSTSYTYIYQ